MRHHASSPSPLTRPAEISHKQRPACCLLLPPALDARASLGLTHKIAQTHPAVRLLGDSLNLGRVEDTLEDGHVRRAGGDRGRAGRLALPLARAATAAAAAATAAAPASPVLLGRVLEDEAHRALCRVLEDKGDVLDPAAQVRVPQEDLAPQLGHLLRRVAVPVAQAEVADDDVADVVVRADAERRPQLVLGHLALVVERVLGPALLELGPAHGRHRHHRQRPPLLQLTLLVPVVRAAEDDCPVRRQQMLAKRGGQRIPCSVCKVKREGLLTYRPCQSRCLPPMAGGSGSRSRRTRGLASRSWRTACSSGTGAPRSPRRPSPSPRRASSRWRRR